MKILVTGGLGFIGSNFILHAFSKNPHAKIINIDAGLSGSNPQNLSELKNKNYRYVNGNITNQKLIEKLVSYSDMVINFAAESHVDRSIANPKPFIDSNIVGVFTILEAIKKFKKRFIQISTDEVFGSLDTGSANEKYPLNPSSPYSSSKASAELLVRSYVKTYGCDAIITRCTNNYGPRQSPEKLIPKTILLAERNKKIPIYGNGRNVRDWIFVLDHCEALLRILFKGKSGESYNISANNEINNITVVRKILQLMGKPDNLIKFSRDRPGHDLRYSLDSKNFERKLKWIPSKSFDEGLEQTIYWYLHSRKWRSNISNLDMLRVSWKTR